MNLFNNKDTKIQKRLKNDHHNVSTENINKIALNSNDDKRLQMFHKFKMYPHRTNAFKLCESEMFLLMKYKDFCAY